MALPAAPGQPTVPQQLPPVGQGSPPGTPPSGGAGGATMPTMNQGMQAAALAKVQWAVRLLEMAIPMIGVGTEVGKDVMKSLQTLSKHVPQGSTSPGVENSALQQLMLQAKQNAPQVQLMRSLGQGGAGGGGGGAASGAPPVAA